MLAKEISDRNAEARLQQWLQIKRLRTEARNKLGNNNVKGKEEGVEIIGEIRDVAEKDALHVTADADIREKLKRDNAKEQVYNAKGIEKEGGASQIGHEATDDESRAEKKIKSPEEIATSDSRKAEEGKEGSGRKNNNIAKWNRARLAKKQKKKDCANRKRLLEQAKRLKKVRTKGKKEDKAKVPTEVDVKVVTVASVVGAVTLDKEKELPTAKVEQVLPKKTIQAGGEDHNTDSSTTTAPTDTSISELKGKKNQMLIREAETNKITTEDSNGEIAKTNENVTQSGNLISWFEQNEDLDLSFLRNWSEDAWFDETDQSPIYNTTERVMVYSSSERRWFEIF